MIFVKKRDPVMTLRKISWQWVEMEYGMAVVKIPENQFAILTKLHPQIRKKSFYNFWISLNGAAVGAAFDEIAPRIEASGSPE